MTDTMQILWCGNFDEDEEFEKKVRKGLKVASFQISQKNLVDGIESVAKIGIDAINGSIVPHYPVYADRKVEEVRWKSKLGADCVSVGYLNLKYYNRLTCKKSMERAAKDWVQNKYTGGDLVVFAYGLRSAPMSVAWKVKQMIPRTRIYCIVTDLPIYMDLGESCVKKILKRIDRISINYLLKKMDGFILYASKMAEYLSIAKEKWILMEGSFCIDEGLGTVEPIYQKSPQKKVLMYSGQLDRQYGIELLLQAFMGIQNPEVELWLTGGGNAHDYISQCVQTDERIKYFGFLPTRDHVLQLQAQADLLINMRLPSEQASAYCFPSKIFEFLYSGKPVLSYRLEGIPKEYEKYLLFIEDETVEATRKAIERAFFISETKRKELGEMGKNFVKTRKNNRYQAQRICEFCGINGKVEGKR